MLLEKIENNWNNIQDSIESTVKLVSKFGYNDKNLVAKLSLLPIAFYLGKLQSKNFVESSDKADVRNQITIQKWLTIALLKNAFGSSSEFDVTKFPILLYLLSIFKTNSHPCLR